MKVGFIGLGRMGRGMAGSLLKASVPLIVYDTSAAAAAALGAEVADDIPELARAADVIFTSLPGPAEVEQVVLGTVGISGELRAGQALFDLSTSSLELARRAEGMFA